MRRKIGSTKYHLTSSKEQNSYMIDEFEENGFFDGMSEGDIKKFESNWVYAMYEVSFDLDIFSDGSYQITKVDGKRLIADE